MLISDVGGQNWARSCRGRQGLRSMRMTLEALDEAIWEMLSGSQNPACWGDDGRGGSWWGPLSGEAGCQWRRRQHGECGEKERKAIPVQQGGGRGPGQIPACPPPLLPRPNRAKSAWQRLILHPRRKPQCRESQVRPEDTNICLAPALLVQTGRWLWGWRLADVARK